MLTALNMTQVQLLVNVTVSPELYACNSFNQAVNSLFGIILSWIMEFWLLCPLNCASFYSLFNGIF